MPPKAKKKGKSSKPRKAQQVAKKKKTKFVVATAAPKPLATIRRPTRKLRSHPHQGMGSVEAVGKMYEDLVSFETRSVASAAKKTYETVSSWFGRGDSAPVAISSSMGGALMGHATAPRTHEFGEGARSFIRFRVGQLGLGSSTNAYCPGNGFINGASSVSNYLGFAVDPSNGTYEVKVATFGGTVTTTTLLPMSYYVPRFASMVRNYSRFRVKYLAIEYEPRVSTDTDGSFTIAYCSDALRAAEPNANEATVTAATMFNYLGSFTKSCTGNAWNKLYCVCIDEREVSTDKVSLLYTLDNLTGTLQTISGLDRRLNWQGVVMFAQDSGNSGAAQLPWGNLYCHMVVDCYEVNLGEPNANLRLDETSDEEWKALCEEHKVIPRGTYCRYRYTEYLGILKGSEVEPDDDWLDRRGGSTLPISPSSHSTSAKTVATSHRPSSSLK